MSYALEIIDRAIDELNAQCECENSAAADSPCWACVEKAKLNNVRTVLLDADESTE